MAAKAQTKTKRWYRQDVGQLGKATRLPNGFVLAEARFTREGVFRYETPQGPRFEYRPASEVFKPASMQSFALAPVTDTHPPKLLNADNADKFAKGSAGETIRRDGDYLTGKVMVTNRQLIAKMDAGIDEVSCGYTCEIDETPGVYKGQRYDCIQKDIVGNHIAIVERGRAGQGAYVRMDHSQKGNGMKRKLVVVRKDELSGMATLKDEAKGYEVEMPLEWASHIQQAYAGAGKPAAKPTPEQDEDQPPTNENSNDDEDEAVPGPIANDDDEPMPVDDDEPMPVDDDEDAPVGPLVAEADEDENNDDEEEPPMVKKTKDRKDSKGKPVKPSNSPVSRREFDRLMARLDARDSAAKQEAKTFGAKVASRAALDRKAVQVLGERFDSSNCSDRKVHLAVLAKLTPKVDYKGRSNDYVEARFDAEVANHARGKDAQRKDYESLARTDSGDNDIADESRKKMLERHQSAWKNGAAKGA